MIRTLRALCGLALLAGCDDHIFPAASHGGEPVAADWDGVQAFMANNCEACHGGEPVAGNGFLQLPQAIEADLANLDEPATDYPELVVPGDSANSHLWIALAFIEDDGVTDMPLGASEPHPDAHVVQEWIDAGASLE